MRPQVATDVSRWTHNVLNHVVGPRSHPATAGRLPVWFMEILPVKPLFTSFLSMNPSSLRYDVVDLISFLLLRLLLLLLLASGANCTPFGRSKAILHHYSPIPSLAWPALRTDRFAAALGTVAGVLRHEGGPDGVFAGLVDRCGSQGSIC